MESLSTFMHTPLGWLGITCNGKALTGLDFISEPPESDDQPHETLVEIQKQLDDYFEGRLEKFSIELEPAGTEFQKAVWQALLSIPFGTTASYHEIAEIIGNPKAVRAVGLANGRNPIPIIIPCHRIIGADGKMVGYAGGLWRKEWLLAHEGSLLL